MKHPLRCRCGTVRGHVLLPATTTRAICYCKDCRAFARFLGRADETLDAAGGSDIVATLPKQVHFEQGLASLACMSLSGKGMLRWYAQCCKTPIGNTPRENKLAYVGLLHDCLSSQPLDASFGPVRIRLNGASALSPVASTPLLPLITAMFRLMGSILPMRLGGRYRDNPFFHADSGAPISQPHVLSLAERQALT
jgi:hypothetical protein